MANSVEPQMPDSAEPGFALGSGRGDLHDVLGKGPVDITSLPGRLITVEGIDGVGRSTHVALLREWLEQRGFAVSHTGLTRSQLAGEGLRQAKAGHTLGRLTMDLFYATDFADRLERDILPSLRAGFVVLVDRYIYSSMARAIVRGTSPDWISEVYQFAPKPHASFCLRVDIQHLIPRVLTRGFDYWESGMDFLEETDVFQSFVKYQTRLLAAMDDLAERFGFSVIDANRSIAEVFRDLREGVEVIVGDMDYGQARGVGRE